LDVEVAVVDGTQLEIQRAERLLRRCDCVSGHAVDHGGEALQAEACSPKLASSEDSTEPPLIPSSFQETPCVQAAGSPTSCASFRSRVTTRAMRKAPSSSNAVTRASSAPLASRTRC